MKSALIGHTGFVGSNLADQGSFDVCYNSKNFRDMANQSYSDIVCAGISAVKWKANKDPENDKKHIMQLQEVLSTVSAQRFILISTIDVYPIISGQDESFDCHSQPNHAYGFHRLEFEDFCSDNFSECYIVRLPGLFGKGLKKNIIFDLLNDNCLDMINPASSFQYYYLKNLWKDIQTAVDNNIRLINLFTEPIATSEILQTCFSAKKVGANPSKEMHYNLCTQHADLFGKTGPYIYDKKEVLQQIIEFVEQYTEQR